MTDTDITEKLIFPDEWEGPEIICRKALDESRGQKSICGCPKCQIEEDKK